MENNERCILTLTPDQMRIVERACEFYTRVMIGQFEEIAHETMMASISQEDYTTRMAKMVELLFQARSCAFPDLTSRGHSYGVGHIKSADLAWDVYQALRYTRAWHENPEGGMGVCFDEPYSTSDEGVPDCRIEKIGADTQWVSVSERLPEKSGKYIVMKENGSVCDAEFDVNIGNVSKFGYGKEYFHKGLVRIDTEWMDLGNVQYWMPMPPMPLEED